MSGFVCSLCPRHCAALRSGSDSGGCCSMGDVMRIARVQRHFWEEPPISGENGSGTVFFAGCSLGCVYCQNREISSAQTRFGAEASPEQLALHIKRLVHEGAHNINFVTGTHFAPQIVKALELYRPELPIVWNSSGYELCETLEMLAPFVDIWLPDYKYALTDAAKKYSDAADYPDVAMAAIKRMRELAPTDVFENGLMKKGVIVRHLQLPGNLRNSIAALRRLKKELPNTLVSIMSQYTPMPGIEESFPELGRTLDKREYEKLLDEAELLGINGFMQEGGAASESFIPEWDLFRLKP